MKAPPSLLFNSSHRVPLLAATLAAAPLAALLVLSKHERQDEDSRRSSSCRGESASLPQTSDQPPRILATSDASADRSASAAAFHRINKSEHLLSQIDSYPTFTSHHNSLLKKYLSRPLYTKLAPLQTSMGTTLEDMITPGLPLPLGANPPRSIGLLAGDAECYTLFAELLNPIVEEYHGVSLDSDEWEDPELPHESHLKKRKTFAYLERLDTVNTSQEDGIIKSGSGDQENDDFEEEDEDYNTAMNLTPNVSLLAYSKPKQVRLRRHSTIINNPLLVTSQQADPDNRYILSTRIRIARSLNGVRFPSKMSRLERRQVSSLIRDCCNNLQSTPYRNGVYIPILEMTTDQNHDLIQRHLLFDNPNAWTIASGFGRDWPDGRGIYANVSSLSTQTPDFMIWVNEEDHLRIMCLRSGGDIQGVFTTVMNGVRELERELQSRGWEFARHAKLGYLTSCPTNVGTTMRASVHVRLEKLGQCIGFHELCKALRLEARGKYGETDRQYGEGIFDISNAERLGKSEVHLINHMVKGVARLIELERALERGEEVDCIEIVRELNVT
jgi:creatine kinase